MIVNPGMLPLPGERSSLLKALEQVTDPRARRGIRHGIASTLAMVVAAGLSGAGRSFRAVGDFAADLPQDALARLGARFHPVRRHYIAPNEATIRRHVQMIDADEADAAVGGWLAAQVQQARVAAGQAGALTTVALDGKVLKGAREELPDIKVTLFSALVHGEGVIIGQRKVPECTTEVTRCCRCSTASPPRDAPAAGQTVTATSPALSLLPTLSTPTATICSRSPTGAGSISSPSSMLHTAPVVCHGVSKSPAWPHPTWIRRPLRRPRVR